jgi:hypothetical protein
MVSGLFQEIVKVLSWHILQEKKKKGRRFKSAV